MINDKVRIQRMLRTGELQNKDVCRTSAETLIALEESDWVALERILHGVDGGGSPKPAWYIGFSLPAPTSPEVAP